MEGRIVDREAFKVVALGWTGPFEYASQIPSLWKTFVSRVGEIQDCIHPGTYTCPSHDRETDFTCYIATEVRDFSNVPDGMMALTVPAHKYAVFTHRGPMERVQDTYMQIFSWLGEHGYEKDYHALTLEVYDQRYNPATDDGTLETNAYDIWVPIR